MVSNRSNFIDDDKLDVVHVECHQNGYKIEYNTVIVYSSLKEKSINCLLLTNKFMKPVKQKKMRVQN